MATSPYVIDYRRSFAFDASPDALWATIMQVDRFEGWWTWLSELRVEGARADNGDLRAGTVLRGVVAPPLPYRMRLCVEIERCQPPTSIDAATIEAASIDAASIDAAVHGDLEGRAGLRLQAQPGGTRAEVAWTIEMRQRPMRVAARLAAPLLRWGHDRVVESTVQSFRRFLGTSPGGPRPSPPPER